MRYAVDMFCKICGKPKGYNISHPQCAREMQKIGQEMNKKKRKTRKLSEKAIEFFAKVDG